MDDDDVGSLSLKELVARLPSKKQQQHIGAAVMPDMLVENADYAATLEREFDTVCVEHHMKWEPMTKRGESRYDFTEADLVVDWALAKGLRVKAHTLVWHVTSPTETWLQGKSDMEIREQVRRHVHTTCGHFYGRVESWDVVNEALSPNAEFANTCFNNHKSSFTPEEFISDCFRWAHAADPAARLIYNENKVESSQFAKSKKMLAMLEEVCLVQRAPIHAVGLQAHFDASAVGWKRAATPAALLEQINHIGTKLALGVNISEMDVRVSNLPNRQVWDLAQSQVYGNTVKACFQSPHFDGLTFWGFSDASTWVTKFYSQDQPLLFDCTMKPKPAYFAVRDALQALVVGAANGEEEEAVEFEDWTKADWAPKSPAAASADSHRPDKQQKLADVPDWQL